MKSIRKYATEKDYQSELAAHSLKYTLSLQEEGDVLRLFGEHDSADSKILRMAASGITYTQASEFLVDAILGKPVPHEMDFNDDGEVNVADMTYITDRKDMFYHVYHTKDSVITDHGNDIYTVSFGFVSYYLDEGIEYDLPANTSEIYERTGQVYNDNFRTEFTVNDNYYVIEPFEVLEVTCNGKELTFASSASTKNVDRVDYTYSDGTVDNAIEVMIVYNKIINKYIARIEDFLGSEEGKQIESFTIKFKNSERRSTEQVEEE